MSKALTNELSDSELSQVVGGSSQTTTKVLSPASCVTALTGALPFIGAQGVDLNKPVSLTKQETNSTGGQLYLAAEAYAKQQNMPLGTVLENLGGGSLIPTMTVTDTATSETYSFTFQTNPSAPSQSTAFNATTAQSQVLGS